MMKVRGRNVVRRLLNNDEVSICLDSEEELDELLVETVSNPDEWLYVQVTANYTKSFFFTFYLSLHLSWGYLKVFKKLRNLPAHRDTPLPNYFKERRIYEQAQKSDTTCGCRSGG